MFNTASAVAYGGARARYRTVDVSSRLEGASPHRLVAILFEELVRAIETAQAADRRGDRGKRAERQARALSILHALEGSLDFERGGEIATSLSSVYREGRRLIGEGYRENRPELVEQARAMLAEIAEAWDGIG
jgi:flagellar secretion chaperone FliS